MHYILASRKEEMATKDSCPQISPLSAPGRCKQIVQHIHHCGLMALCRLPRKPSGDPVHGLDWG